MDSKLKVREIILIGGYKRHGKDTFYRQWLRREEQVGSCPFVVFARTAGSVLLTADTRHSFAQAVKDEVKVLLGVPNFDDEQYKDVPLFPIDEVDPLFPSASNINTLVSFRYYLKQHAMAKRAEDPEHWAKKVSAGLEYDPNGIILALTDFRFQTEYEHLSRLCPVTTVRVHCYGEEVPPADDNTEHDLDDFEFDFVALRWLHGCDVLVNL